jgi:hypothetical protein
MATRMQQRRGTAEQWLLADPVLAAGEIGFETDTGSFKIGDGVNSWLFLDYFETSATLAGTLSDYIEIAEKGQPLGVAELDANGFVLASQLDIDVTADVNAAIAALVDSAPETLDTLNELAAALGDDPNFATNIATQIGGKADTVHTHLLADVTDVTATATELSYVSGVTSTIQAQIDAKPDNVSDLDDVTITSASSGELLVYNGNVWTNSSIIDGGGA